MMAKRLTKIYTRTGDKGTTGLGNGGRTEKDCARMEAIGTVDELNSALGMVLAHPIPEAVQRTLSAVQNDLFDLGSELSLPGHEEMSADHIKQLENALDGFNKELPPLREFILPAGGHAAAACHLARAIARRAERRAVTLRRTEAVRHELLAYLNRLSDLLFVLARTLARSEGGSEVLWERGKK
jgi:cob(I)alamin adenosyltransferase